jgi:hypothetical protein
MSAKLTVTDAKNYASTRNISLVGDYLSPNAPTHWVCSIGHSFKLSLNSLKRRVKSDVSTCPGCHRIELAEKRVSKEFAEAQNSAAKNGLIITSLPSDYQNQNSLLAVTCQRCAVCTAKPMSAEKIKLGQGCAVLGREKSSVGRRLSFKTIQQTIASHPLAFTLLSGPSDYQNNQSKLKFSCVNGHKFEMTFSDLQRRDRLRGCEQCGETAGQSISTAIVADLLCIEPLREFTPPFLNQGWQADRKSLRFDSFFHPVTICSGEYSLALEYHGPQHFDATHHFHKKSCRGAAVAFQRLIDGDQHKRNACAMAGVVLLEIDGRYSKTIAELCSSIINKLEQALPKLVEDTLYLERKNKLADSATLKKILHDDKIRSNRIEKLRDQLAKRQIDVISIDTVADRASCKCRICEHAWPAMINNLLEGVSTDRRGTGCPKCQKRHSGKQRRLSEETVIARARVAGWIPRWPAGSYAGQTQKLKWDCATIGCLGHRETDFQHLSRGKCKICNAGAAK